MKKFLVLIAILLLPIISKAEEVKLSNVLDKIPALKQGMAYSIVDNKFNYLTTTEIANIGKYVNIEAGYAGSAESTNHKAVAVASVNLLEAGDIHYPILKYVKFNPGVYMGFGNINFKEIGESELDWGVSATLFEIKL